MKSWWCAIAALLIGCGGGGDAAPQTQTGDTFLAFPTHFASFRSWPSFHSDGPDPAKFPDVAGARMLYLNKVPAHGAKTYPVGTIIVEVHEDGDKRIFARVKRGGGFNSDGALDWEWFELEESQAGNVNIVWRGFGPPAGESYGGDKGGCNNCHSGFRDNDFVASQKLLLTSF